MFFAVYLLQFSTIYFLLFNLLFIFYVFNSFYCFVLLFIFYLLHFTAYFQIKKNPFMILINCDNMLQALLIFNLSDLNTPDDTVPSDN